MASPIAQYLNTNYAPSDSELKWIQSHLIPHIHELSRLDSLIQDLVAQRDKTLTYIEAHKALLSPARRLPPEILQEIFLAALPTHRSAVMSASEAPLVLTRICRGWRSLALATPELWHSIHLPFDYLFDHNPTASRAAQAWLERSGHCPMSVSINTGRVEEWVDAVPEEVDLVVAALAGCADRWRRIDLVIGFIDSIPQLAAIYPPNLVTLDMQCRAVDATIAQMKMLTPPSLRSVTLRIRRDFDQWVPIPLPWENLTSITFETAVNREAPVVQSQGLSPPAILDLLRQCPRVVHFQTDLLALPSGFPPSPAPLSSLSVPSLQEFIICWCGSNVGTETVDYILRYLFMPQLRCLQLPRIRLTSSNPTRFLGELAAHSPLLEELRFDLTGLSQQSIAANLPELVQLKTLVVLDTRGPLRASSDTPATAQTLLRCLNSTTPPVCPLLQELRVKNCHKFPAGDSDLLNFARRRLDYADCRLRCLEVEYMSFTPAIALEDRAQLSARGLFISTSCPPAAPIHPSSTPWTGLEDIVVQ
ncbi:hypothetical protein C8R46DRAFT_183872 [Mycena filopes]|nr:hypothetical protein C8R46DRAFT_183872 [Mycena filopes]